MLTYEPKCLLLMRHPLFCYMSDATCYTSDATSFVTWAMQHPLFCYSGTDWGVTPCQPNAGFDTCFVRSDKILRSWFLGGILLKIHLDAHFRYDANIWPNVGLARGCATSGTGARVNVWSDGIWLLTQGARVGCEERLSGGRRETVCYCRLPRFIKLICNCIQVYNSYCNCIWQPAITL